MNKTKYLRYPLTVLLALALAAAAVAGTKKAPPPTPKTPLERFEAELKQLDPKASVILGVLPGIRDDEAMVMVSNAFHRVHYQERLQSAQSLWHIWRKIINSPMTALVLVDRAGNRVGRVGPTGDAWVQKP